nr:PREDICTED: guanine nucleotide-binding protein G(I)/G(S)/G(O) subunit gamma-10-like [Phalacrocorax carbo]
MRFVSFQEYQDIHRLVSQAAAELQQYCMQNACKDALLVGVPAGSNPFREPRSCALL